MPIYKLSMFILLVFHQYIFVEALKQTDETRLLKYLLTGYNRKARPVINASDTTQVEISMKIMQLDDINTKSQFISVIGWVSTYWIDERLTWNKSDFGGIDYVALLPEDIWVPTFTLVNTASDNVYDEFWYMLFKAKVQSNGVVHWAPGGKFKSECIIDVQWFPFDDQICHFRFENWVYTGDKVNLTYSSNAEENLLKYYNGHNGQWNIIDKKVNRHDSYFDHHTPYPEVHFGLHVQRKVLYYVTNIIFVSALLEILVLLMFKLPVESGERVSMGVTLLLAFSVFILMVNESIPETSSAVPVIIIYLVGLMAFTTLAIAESIFILYCYHQSGEKSPPKMALKVVKIISKVIRCKIKEKVTGQNICCNKTNSNSSNNGSSFSSKTGKYIVQRPLNKLCCNTRTCSKGNNIPATSNMNGISDKKDEKYELSKKEGSHVIREEKNCDNSSHNGVYIVGENEQNYRHHEPNIKSIYDKYEQRKHETVNDGGDLTETEQNIADWQSFGRHVDDISFWLSLFVFVFFQILVLTVLPYGTGKKDFQKASESWHITS